MCATQTPFWIHWVHTIMEVVTINLSTNVLENAQNVPMADSVKGRKNFFSYRKFSWIDLKSERKQLPVLSLDSDFMDNYLKLATIIGSTLN